MCYTSVLGIKSSQLFFFFARSLDHEDLWKYTNGMVALGCMNNADLEKK